MPLGCLTGWSGWLTSRPPVQNESACNRSLGWLHLAVYAETLPNGSDEVGSAACCGQSPLVCLELFDNCIFYGRDTLAAPVSSSPARVENSLCIGLRWMTEHTMSSVLIVVSVLFGRCRDVSFFSMRYSYACEYGPWSMHAVFGAAGRDCGA
jgi:hypothetical protein